MARVSLRVRRGLRGGRRAEAKEGERGGRGGARAQGLYDGIAERGGAMVLIDSNGKIPANVYADPRESAVESALKALRAVVRLTFS